MDHTTESPTMGNNEQQAAMPESEINAGLYALLEELQREAQAGTRRGAERAGVKADVVFVIDSTGSMSPYIANVKDNIAEFARYLNDKGLDLRIGFVEFKDITADGLNSTIVHKAGDSVWMSVEAFAQKLIAIKATGGGDEPETPIDGLGYLLDGKSMFWGVDAFKFAFLLTDASYKPDNRHGYASLETAADGLLALGVHVSVGTRMVLFSKYSPLNIRTGGINADIAAKGFSSGFKDFADNIVDVSNKF